MHRKDFIQQATLASAALFANTKAWSHQQRIDHTSLTVLHTNDVHSRLDPMPMDGGKYEGKGGVLNRKKAIDELKSYGKKILLLDSGDMFQGTPYFNLYKGAAEIKAMTYLGYDAGTIGNHDFDGGIENLANQLEHASFPLINCNYTFTNTPLQDKVLPYKIIKRSGARIGIIGVGIELYGLVPEKLYGNTIYTDPIAAANKYSNFLKKEKKCDMVICLSHLGFEYTNNKISDKVLASKTANIDLILGGHTHTFLDAPITVNNVNNSPVIINQVGFGGIYMGSLEFDFFQENNKNNVMKHHSGVFLKKTNII